MEEGAQPHQKEAQRGGPQHREQNGNQKPGGNQNAARAQHAHGSKRITMRSAVKRPRAIVLMNATYPVCTRPGPG